MFMIWRGGVYVSKMAVYFDLFGIKIPAYGTMALIGLLVAMTAAVHYAKVYYIPVIDVLYSACYGSLGLIIGAKLFYALPFLPELMHMIGTEGFLGISRHIREILLQMFAGYVFYGGLIGIIAGIAFYTHYRRLPMLVFANVLAIVIPLFHGFGRIGCFLAGCCYGKEYHGPFAVTFPKNPYEPDIELTERFPVQLLESVCNFLLFAVLAVYGRKPREAGRLMGIYLTAYPVIRFCTELLRGDEIRGVINIGAFEISTSQIISLLLLPCGILLYRQSKKNK